MAELRKFYFALNLEILWSTSLKEVHFIHDDMKFTFFSGKVTEKYTNNSLDGDYLFVLEPDTNMSISENA